MKIYSGSANKPLAEEIASSLHTTLSPLEIHTFPDGEKRIQVIENVLGEDVVIVQPTAPHVAEYCMELFFMIDAAKRSGAKSVTIVVPYLGYQRQDHIFRSGEAVSLDVVRKIMEAVGADRIVVYDAHSVKVPEMFQIPVIHLSALPLFAEKIKELGWMDETTILVTPDMGGIRRIKHLSELLENTPYASIEKNRDLGSGDITADTIHGLVGSKKRAIIVDDMISSGKTIVMASELLLKQGIEEVVVFATHPVFSENASVLLQHSSVTKVFVTNTIFVPQGKQFAKLEILSVADTIAKHLRV